MAKRKKKQKSPLIPAIIACGLYFYMIGCVFMSEPEKPRVKQVSITQVKPVRLYDSAGHDIDSPQAKYKLKNVKPKKLSDSQIAENKLEEKYQLLLLYGNEQEYQEAKAWFAGKKPGYVEANKLMANK